MEITKEQPFSKELKASSKMKIFQKEESFKIMKKISSFLMGIELPKNTKKNSILWSGVSTIF